MAPSRVLRATIFLEDKITRKDLNYRTPETQCLSLRLLPHCGIERGPSAGQKGSFAIHILFHFSPFTLICLYFLSFFFFPGKLTFERVWTSS